MEHHIFIIILAIATFFFINLSTAAVMAASSEFELAESGVVIVFGAALGTSGGLDPPASAITHQSEDAQASDRFEMRESGIMIDFSRFAADGRIVGFRPSPVFNHPGSARAEQEAPLLEVHEMSESGNLIVFPRQVEKRKAQALWMRSRDRVVSDKN